MIPSAELDKLHREVETALGHFDRAQKEFEAAVAAHARTRELAAELADLRDQLSRSTKAYREAVLDFLAANEPAEQVPRNPDRNAEIP